MMEAILTTIKQILAEMLEKDEVELELLAPDSNYMLELGLSSIDGLQLLTLLEDRFGIYIEDDELSSDLFLSLKHTAEFLLKKIKDPIC